MVEGLQTLALVFGTQNGTVHRRAHGSEIGVSLADHVVGVDEGQNAGRHRRPHPVQDQILDDAGVLRRGIEETAQGLQGIASGAADGQLERVHSSQRYCRSYPSPRRRIQRQRRHEGQRDARRQCLRQAEDAGMVAGSCAPEVHLRDEGDTGRRATAAPGTRCPHARPATVLSTAAIRRVHGVSPASSSWRSSRPGTAPPPDCTNQRTKRASQPSEK